jgi:hypothetical protein
MSVRGFLCKGSVDIVIKTPIHTHRHWVPSLHIEIKVQCLAVSLKFNSPSSDYYVVI